MSAEHPADPHPADPVPTGSGVVVGERRQLNPLSPIAQAAQVIPILILVLVFTNGGALWRTGLAGIPIAVLAIVGLTVLFTVYRYLAWRRFTFWFDESDNLRIDSGIFFRNERKVQLSRLQAVDIEQPLLARIFNLALLRIEIAGAGDSKVALAYLSQPDAVQLRTELLTHTTAEAAEELQEEETLITQVATRDLIISLLIRTTTFSLLLATIALAVIAFMTDGVVGLALMPVTGGVPLFAVVSEFLTLYGFKVAKSRDGVRLRFGLLKTTAATVPHGRVVGVEIVEPFLWRYFGWVRLRLTIAGAVTSDANDSSTTSVLLPVGKRDVAYEVLAHVMPGVEVDRIELQSTDRRARWRAPIQWSRLAIGHSDQVFVARRGRVTRYLAIVPHARTQSVTLKQGPYQRRLDLATVMVDVPRGPVKPIGLYLPRDLAQQTVLAQVARARTARSTDWSK